MKLDSHDIKVIAIGFGIMALAVTAHTYHQRPAALIKPAAWSASGLAVAFWGEKYDQSCCKIFSGLVCFGFLFSALLNVVVDVTLESINLVSSGLSP